MTKWQLQRSFSLLLAAVLVYGCASMGVSPQDKKRANASIKLAEIYLSEGNTALAMQELVKAQKLNPDDPFIYNNFGMIYIEKENYQLAIVNFEKALALKPDYPEARNNLGSAYLGLEQWDKAIPIFEALMGDVLYTKPHFPLTNLGWAYYNKGDYKTAESYLNQALEIQPGLFPGPDAPGPGLSCHRPLAPSPKKSSSMSPRPIRKIRLFCTKWAKPTDCSAITKMPFWL